MNDRIIKLGLESHMLNYIDNETPRCYFLSAHADEDDLQKFAELIVRECAEVCNELQKWSSTEPRHCASDILKHFGVEE